MNKRLFTRKILRTAIWLFLLTTLFIACQKGLESGFPWQEDQNSLTDPALPLDVSMAKSFYKDLKEKAGDQVIVYKVDNHPFIDELPVLKSQSSFTNRKTPLFSQASTYENAINSYVEIPLFYNRRSAMIIAADSCLKGKPRAQERVFRASFDRLLVYKSKLSGKSGSYIITYQPSLAYLEKYGYRMENNRLNQLDTAFCGYLEYKSWEGKHLYYRQIEKGKLVKVSNLATGRAVVYGRGQLQKTQKKLMLKSQDDCGSIEVPTYTETCIQEDPEKSKETCVEVEGTAEKTEECEEENNEQPGANLCEEIGIDCPEGDYIFDEPSGPDVDASNPAIDSEISTTLDTTMSKEFIENDRLNCILSKLMTSNFFKKTINYFTNSNSRLNLSFAIGTLPDDVLGSAAPNPLKWDAKEIKMTFDVDKLPDLTNLEIALTFLHEGIHASIYSYLLNVGGPSNLTTANFPTLLEYYRNYKREEYPQHQLMADHYIDIMAHALSTIDHEKFDISYYKSLSWRGLLDTDAYKSIPGEQTIEMRKKINDLLKGRKKDGCDD